MRQRISATEARIHFGELMRQASEQKQPVIVERDGKPQIVVLAIDEYERLVAGQHASTDWLAQIDQLRERIRVELGDRQMPPSEEIIRQMREERDAQLLDLH
jgi:prevent-host-death family protein